MCSSDLSRAALSGAALTLLLMGAMAAAYGPLLPYLMRRFTIGVSVAGLVFAASPRRATWQPIEPVAADWRPAGTGWQELTPSLVWADDETGD